MDGGGDGRRPGSTAVGPGRLGAGGPVRSSGSGVDRDGFRVSRRLPLGGSGWAPLPPLEGPAASRDRGSLGLAAGSRSALSWALAGPVTLPSPAAPQKTPPEPSRLAGPGRGPPLPPPIGRPAGVGASDPTRLWRVCWPMRRRGWVWPEALGVDGGPP